MLLHLHRLIERFRRNDGQYVILAVVIASTFFVGFGGGVVFPIIPNLGAVLGISPFLVGLILGANRLSRLIVSAPAGGLVDRIGTRKPFVVGMFIQALATLGYVVAIVVPPPEVWFLAARILWGVGSALVFATAYTIAADVSDGPSRGTSMGLVRGGILFGAPSGLVVGGVISEVAGTVPAFLLATLLATIGGVIAYLKVPETHVEEGMHTAVKPWNIDTSLPSLTAGAINFAVMFVYFGVLFSTLVLFLSHKDLGIFGFDAQGTSGIFMAITVVTAGVFMFLGGLISDRRMSRVPVLICFLGIMSAGFLVLAYAGSLFTLTLACLGIGAGQGGAGGPLMALLGDITPGERMGRAIGTNNALGDVGGGLGPLIALPSVDWLGFGPIFLTSATLPIVAAVILLVGVHLETGRFFPQVKLTSE